MLTRLQRTYLTVYICTSTLGRRKQKKEDGRWQTNKQEKGITLKTRKKKERKKKRKIEFLLTKKFGCFCITEHVVYCLSCTKCPSTVYIGETGPTFADRFREHCRDVINGRNDLPVPAHFNSTNHTLDDMKVVVLKEGLANQDYRKKQEMSLIFKYGTMCPSVTLTKTLVSHESLFFAYLHTGTRYFMWHVCKCSIRHVS